MRLHDFLICAYSIFPQHASAFTGQSYEDFGLTVDHIVVKLRRSWGG